MIYDYPFKSNYIEIFGHKLHYIDEGKGPVIVMLHGNPTWSFYFRHLVKELSGKFRVIVPDHMGCGLSDKPQSYEYNLAAHISNLEILLKKLEVEALSLVVHDWGGAIGFGYVVKNVEKVQRIVALNTAAFRSHRIPFRIRICRWPWLGALIVRGFNGFAWPATFMAVKNPLSKKTAKAYLKPYDNWENRVAIHEFVRDIPLNEKHPSYEVLLSIEENLPIIRNKKIPILLVWGGKDFCFNDHFLADWKKFFPEADYRYLENAGHYVLEDGHGVVEPIISEFFEDLVSAKDEY